MSGGRNLISRYVLWTIFPYFLLAVLVLTAVLFTQQAGRFAEIIGSTQAPLQLAGEVALALLPNVLIFALPMATLVGTATAFSKIGSDSELIAMYGAGVGPFRIVTPALLFAALVAVCTLYTGFQITPIAARLLRDTALRATLYKLDSPVEPRSFTTDIPGKVIYVRDGDERQGLWGRVFIESQDSDGKTRLLSAQAGRIDTSGERSELVLNDALITTLSGRLPDLNSTEGKTGEIISERSSQLRVRLETGRTSLLEELRNREPEPDELNWRALLDRIKKSDGDQKRAAVIAFHKRLALCLAPLTFAFCGATLGLRWRRGGRGLGIFVSLSVMLIYYLIELAGEQLAHAGAIPATVGPWLATGVAVAFGTLLLIAWQKNLRVDYFELKLVPRKDRGYRIFTRRKNSHANAFTGLLDRVVLKSIGWMFAGTLMVLIAIFLIFTLFELLRFLAIRRDSVILVAKYLFFLLPFTIVALAPVSMLVASLISYALMARRSEAIAWWAAGQSVFRLTVPGLFFATFISGAVWLVEERVMPRSNQKQDILRSEIRGGVSSGVTPVGRQWLASKDGKRLYSYDFDEKSHSLAWPVVFEFDDNSVHLTRVLLGARGVWIRKNALQLANVTELNIEPSNQTGSHASALVRHPGNIMEPEGEDLFRPSTNKPSQMNFSSLKNYIEVLEQKGVGSATIAPLDVALERKRAEPFSTFVMGLMGIPLALAFGRRSAIASLCVAVAAGLVFWGITSGCEQLGSYGFLPAGIAAWSPPLVFASMGLHLLARTRT